MVDQPHNYTKIAVCTNLRTGDILPSCKARGSEILLEILQKAAPKFKLEIVIKHCLGRCHLGPTMRLLPGGPFLVGMDEADMDELIRLLESQSYDILIEKWGYHEES